MEIEGPHSRPLEGQRAWSMSLKRAVAGLQLLDDVPVDSDLVCRPIAATVARPHAPVEQRQELFSCEPAWGAFPHCARVRVTSCVVGNAALARPTPTRVWKRG